MLLEVVRNIKVKETINVEFPYYYKQDLYQENCDSIIYGKIEENKHTSIQVTEYYISKECEFTLKIENHPATYYSEFMVNDYKSNPIRFIKAKHKMLKAVKDL